MVYGGSLPELFEHAAQAFFHVLTDRKRVRGREARAFHLEANGLEELLVDWLNEFLYLFDTRSLLFRRFQVQEVDEHHLKATAWGEALDEGRHPIKTLIKAVTFHQLQVRQEEGVWKAQLIFDL
jgi:SHS2 domain-containing protein